MVADQPQSTSQHASRAGYESNKALQAKSLKVNYKLLLINCFNWTLTFSQAAALWNEKVESHSRCAARNRNDTFRNLKRWFNLHASNETKHGGFLQHHNFLSFFPSAAHASLPRPLPRLLRLTMNTENYQLNLAPMSLMRMKWKDKNVLTQLSWSSLQEFVIKSSQSFARNRRDLPREFNFIHLMKYPRNFIEFIVFEKSQSYGDGNILICFKLLIERIFATWIESTQLRRFCEFSSKAWCQSKRIYPFFLS